MTDKTNTATHDFAEELIDSLEAAGYEWRSYSGRAMSGKQCVGVVLDDVSELYALGQALAEQDGVGKPRLDNMGRKIIAYWPHLLVSDDRE